MNRLQTVTNIGQGTANDDAHGIFDIGLFHFVHQITLGNVLVGEQNILRLIITVMFCHYLPPFQRYKIDTEFYI